jgi:hypothetical protein
MATNYGTIIGVKDKCKMFAQVWQQNNPDDNLAIENANIQASDMVRDMLQTRYDIATIDATPPEAVVQLTETIAAILITQRWGLTTGANTEEYLDRLQMQKDHYIRLIVTGNILDASSNPLATNQVVNGYSPISNSTLTELYD